MPLKEVDSSHLSRRQFIQKTPLALAGGLLSAGFVWDFKELFPRNADTSIGENCSVQNKETSNDIEEIIFKTEKSLSLGEPAVAVVDNQIVAAAVVRFNKPLHIWTYDLTTKKQTLEKLALNKTSILGADPVIAVLPDHKVAIFSIAYTSLLSDRRLVLSVYETQKKGWSHRELDFSRGFTDKPWFVWQGDRGWLTYKSDAEGICLYSCDSRLNLKKEGKYAKADSPASNIGLSLPIALPAEDGIHVIFNFCDYNQPVGRPKGNLSTVVEAIFDPKSGRFSGEKVIVKDVPNKFVNEREHTWFLEKNLNGLVTSKGGLIITTAKEDKVIVGYLGKGRKDWQIQEFGISENIPNKKPSLIGFVNPITAGQNTTAVTFIGALEDKNRSNEIKNYALLFEEKGGKLVLSNKAQVPYIGPYPCDALENIQIGDYIQAISDLSVENGVPFVSLNHTGELRVKLFSQMR